MDSPSQRSHSDEAGKTIITTTHELEIVPVIAHRVIVLGEDRKVLADGLPEIILRDHDLLVQANLIHPDLHEFGLRHSYLAREGVG